MSGFLSTEQLESFLTPLSEVLPAGEYLKNNRRLYRPLRNAYNIARTSLQKLSLNPDPAELDDLVTVNRENWLQLEEMLLEILKNHSRDLECMAWLAMAELFSENPYGRLAGVINLIRSTVGAFWPKIQPWLPDDKVRARDTEGAARERAEFQIRPLKLLFGESEDSCQMAVPLRMLPLVGDIDYARYHQKKQREENQCAGLKQEIRSNFSALQAEITERINSIQDVLDALDSLDSTLKACFASLGLTAPGSRFLRSQLEANLQALRDLTDGMIVPWPPDVRRSAEVKINNAEKTGEDKPASGEAGESLQFERADINPESEAVNALSFDRNRAFHQLRVLADYFQRTEPQSPVSYLLEKAIRWGYTPLPELMHELLQGNEQTLNRITDLTGMNMTSKTPIPGPSSGHSGAVAVTKPVTVAGKAPEQSFPVAKIKKPSPQSAETPVANKPSGGISGLSISNLDDLV